MTLPWITLLTLLVLGAGYRWYGAAISRWLAPDRSADTPSRRFTDGVDYVPTAKIYLLPQHFAAIAAAGPIAGPILACSQFGWLPCLIWITLGVVFIGAVHDFTTLFASVRHDAKSIAEIARRHVGSRSANALLVFIWIALVYVVMSFTDITAATFVGVSEEVDGSVFNAKGAVASASTMYLALALVMGFVQRLFKPPLWVVTLIFVPATLVVVQLGTEASTWFLWSRSTWSLVILGYCFVASLLPVWVLLQPRGYLGGFVLYLALAVGTYGVLFGGASIVQPAIKDVAFLGLEGAPIFPFLFVTIACGACSGFHGLVCSGTTSKQIDRETDCAPIGYGAMLLEGFVALIALATVMIVSGPEASAPPGTIYGNGLGRFMTSIVGEEHFRVCATFGAMAFSTFVFDTLDVAVRLGRYIVQELFGLRGVGAAIGATILTVGVPGLLLTTSEPDSYRAFWNLFGTSNQLLAALSLLAITAWLKRTGRPYHFTLIPTLVVLVITICALVLQTRGSFLRLWNAGFEIAPLANGCVAVGLLVLAIFIGTSALRAIRSPAIERERS